MWAIGTHYHFPPSEIGELYMSDMMFWADGIEWYAGIMESKNE